MTDKLFKVVGTTLFKGTYKVRWATDMVTRFKMLHKGGHTDIELFDLPEPMTKQQATEWLVDQECFNKLCDDAQYAVNAKLDEYHAVKTPVKVSLEEIANRPTIDTSSWETVNTGTENTPEVAE
jgi:hypothetical protein